MNRAVVIFLITLYAIGLTIPWLDRPFVTRGESREALVVERMLETGNWLLPRVYDGAVPSKPPLLHLGAATLNLVLHGDQLSEGTLRFFSALPGILFALYFVVFLSKRIPIERTFIAGMVLVSAAEWYRSGMTFRVDLLFSSLLAGALLSGFRWWEKGMLGFPFVSSLLLALATLTKGPVALALSFLIFFIFLASSRKVSVPVVIKTVYWLIPGGLTLLLWYFVAWLEGGSDFFQKVWYENVARFSSTTADRPHDHSIFFLIGSLWLGFMPWSLHLSEMVVTSVREKRFRAWVSVQKLKSAWTALSDFEKFSAVSGIVLFLFFSIPSSKRGVYLLPAYPFLAVLASRIISDAPWFTTWCLRAIACVLCMTTGVVALLGVVVLFTGANGVAGTALNTWTGVWQLAQAVGHYQSTTEGVLALLTALGFSIYALKFSYKASEQAVVMCCSWGCLMVAMSSVVQGIIGAPLSQLASPKDWARYELADVAGDMPLYSFGTEFYAVSLYVKKEFHRIVDHIPSSGFIFAERKNVEKLKGTFGAGCNFNEVPQRLTPLASEKSQIVLMALEGGCGEKAVELGVSAVADESVD